MEGSTMLAPVSHRFSQLDPNEFQPALEGISVAEEQWKKLAVAQVEAGTISPFQAGGIISAVTAQLYGYREFSRELTPADLVLLQAQYER
jgi:hypothetical protein